MKKIIYFICLCLVLVMNYFFFLGPIGVHYLCVLIDFVFIVFSIIFIAKYNEKKRVVPSDDPAVDEGRVYRVEGSFDDYKKK